MSQSEFVISLDFELLWGVRDQATRESYGTNVLGAREAIPRILDRFTRAGVNATWATVGFLFCEGREHLESVAPKGDDRPGYRNQRFSSYHYLDEVGESERAAPHYFAPSLIRQIALTPGQEIATHTLSHYYCLEDGQTIDQFRKDLSAATALAAAQGVATCSIVFPRNQYSSAHLAVCRDLGIDTYRGNPRAWAYRPVSGAGQNSLRRGLRLIDAYTGILGHQHYAAALKDGNVPASQFLRPRTGRLARFHPWHLKTICQGMSAAARQGRGYHLWWHPHNFGLSTDENLAALDTLLGHFKQLEAEHGMISRTMAEAAR